MVRPDRYVCQSWHVAAKVVIQPYLRKSRRNRIEEEQGEVEEEEDSGEESEQFETVVPPASEAPFYTAREEDDYSVTEHSPSILSEASQTLQEQEGSNAGRGLEVSKTFMLDQTSGVKAPRVCKADLDQESETLIDKNSGRMKRTEKDSELSNTLVSNFSKTLVNSHPSCSDPLSQTLLPCPPTEQFHSVAQDLDDLEFDRTTSITFIDPRDNSTFKEDSKTLVEPSSTTVLANPETSHSEQLLLECNRHQPSTKQCDGEGLQFKEALQKVKLTYLSQECLLADNISRWTNSFRKPSSIWQSKASAFQHQRRTKD